MSLVHEMKSVPVRKPTLGVTTARSHLQHLLRFLDGGRFYMLVGEGPSHMPPYK